MIRPGRITLEDLAPGLKRLWSLSGQKILLLERSWRGGREAPVLTVQGRYKGRAWTDWTEGFVYGSALLHFEATGDRSFLELGRRRTLERMTRHLTDFGVHDHGFNIVSTYGNLLRLARSGRFRAEPYEEELYKMALQISGAVQARRWTSLPGGGFIHSFHGPHSLFADTMRSLRSLALAHILGQRFRGEDGVEEELLSRLLAHAAATARYNVYYGRGRDIYDQRGRVAQESIFNISNGSYRNPSTQQGYSPFGTWARGLAWVLLGMAEQLEFLRALGRRAPFMMEAARACADFYIARTPSDGIPPWDYDAPGGDREPKDSSAAVVAAQGLLRLGRLLGARGLRYWQAGLAVTARLLTKDYLSLEPSHQGLLLHSIYHRPAGWDHVPRGRKEPCGESSQWGDYHLRELGVYLERLRSGGYHSFFEGLI